MGSTETLAAAMGAGMYAQPLEDVCIRFGIVSALEKSHFLAHVAAESQGFSRVRENLGYSAARLLEVFPGRNGLTTLAQAKGIVAGGRNAVAEAIYGGAWGTACPARSSASPGVLIQKQPGTPSAGQPAGSPRPSGPRRGVRRCTGIRPSRTRRLPSCHRPAPRGGQPATPG